MPKVPVVMTIAGSDPSGGAGILADIKTFERFDVFGTCVVTLVTAQNTRGVQRVELLSEDVVDAQLESVVSDFEIAAAKIGALGGSPAIRAVSKRLRTWSPGHLVVDPVMVSKHGDRLLDQGCVAELERSVFPHAHLLTPNILEAELLLGARIHDVPSMRDGARALEARYGVPVLITGGSLVGDDAIDVLCEGGEQHVFRSARQEPTNTHGTGCTFSAAIAALLARGESMQGAIRRSKDYIDRAMHTAPQIGGGVGPLNHRA